MEFNDYMLNVAHDLMTEVNKNEIDNVGVEISTYEDGSKRIAIDISLQAPCDIECKVEPCEAPSATCSERCKQPSSSPNCRCTIDFADMFGIIQTPPAFLLCELDQDDLEDCPQWIRKAYEEAYKSVQDDE